MELPLYVVTGFLGAGKTTALNRALADPRLARSAVIVNEFGDAGLDHLFVSAAGDSLIELANGCVCCTIRGQLTETLEDLELERIDRVIVETTGLADPVPVLQAVQLPALAGRYRFRGLACVVDALNAAGQLARHGEARRQAALANRLLVSKLDMVPPEERPDWTARLQDRLRELNGHAPIRPANEANAVAALLREPGAEADLSDLVQASEPGPASGRHDHVDSAITTVTLRHDRPMPRRAIEAFCELMTSAHGARLLRLKGVVAVEEDDRPFVIHCVGGVMHEPEWLAAWPDDRAGTTVVVILDGMAPRFVERLFAGFADLPGVDQADRVALTDNPLAVPGHRFGG